MLKIYDIHKAHWDENIVVCNLSCGAWFDIKAFYNITTGCIEEYSDEYCDDIPSALEADEEKEVIRAICSYLKN